MSDTDVTHRAPNVVPWLVSSIDYTVERTVERWHAGGAVEQPALDWPRLLVGALQHRVEGLCADSLRALGWHELAPPSVVHALERRALLAEARFQAHYQALRELRDLDEELLSTVVLLNGAAVVGDYAMTSHRMVGDFDLLVDVDHAERLAARTRQLGYWEKAGSSGPTYFKDTDGGLPGACYVGLDVHYVVPTMRRGDPVASVRHWGENLVPHMLGDVKVHRASRGLELLHLLVRLYEHATSWVQWTREDDIRLIHLLDIELLAGGLDGRATDVLAHGQVLGVTPELSVGLAVLRAVRGPLPGCLGELEPYAAAAAACTQLLALPTGEVVRLDEPLATRAFCVDKSVRALSLLGGSLPREQWFSWRRGRLQGHEQVADIAARASELLAAAGLVVS